MNATIIDLRYRMKDVLRALERREEVSILWHGKRKGVIRPEVNRTTGRVTEHPFFGMCKSNVTVDAEMDALRGGRVHAV
jgi:hypothetical protein